MIKYIFMIIVLMLILFVFSNNNFAQVINVQPQSYANATATVIDSGLINEHYTSVSNHSVYIFNDSSVTSIFVVTFQLCATNNGCVEKVLAKNIKSHSDLYLVWILTQDVVFYLPGIYTLTATSSIVGPSMSLTGTGTAPANIILPRQIP